jgi:hypothetical protein
MSGPSAASYRKMIEVSAAGRVGTADEVATAAAFLLGPDAGFITGTDLLIDGGVIAALRAGRWQLTLWPCRAAPAEVDRTPGAPPD